MFIYAKHETNVTRETVEFNSIRLFFSRKKIRNYFSEKTVNNYSGDEFI